MDRRFALTGLTIASTGLIAGAAFGQTVSLTMGDLEKKHITDTAKVGTLSLAVSRIAETRAAHPKVKEFAQLETAEQETVADVLMSMQMPPEQASGTITPPTDAEVDAKLDADGKAMVAKLKTLSGAAFDSTYIKAQVDGHNKLLAIQEDYLKAGKNRENLDVAKLARGVIKEHLMHLASLPAAL